MCKVFGAFFILVISVVAGLPTRDELMFDLGGDTAVVESTVRETRAAPEHIEDLLQPGVKDAYLHTYGDAEGDDGDVQGYSKQTNDKGSDGYKHFDTYHKKDGDKYGFEAHSAFGKAQGAEVGAGGKSEKYSDADENEKAEDDGEETKNSYQVVEELNEDDKKKKAIEDYGDFGFADSEGLTDGESEDFTDGAEGDGAEESENFSDGEGESENLEAEGEGYDDGEPDSGHYTSEDGDSGSLTAADDDDGESQSYTAEDDEGDY